MPARLKPARIEDVIDGVKLRAQLTAAHMDHFGDEQAARKRALQLLHGALFRGRIIAKERLENGAGGLETALLLSRVADEVISALYDYTTTHVFRSRNPTAGERFTVAAVGGYGRQQMGPSSDIDLLFLRAYKKTAWTESVIEYMLYMMWDLGLKVGHSSRTVDECLRLAKHDHTIQTALLEARRISGDESLFKEFQAKFQKEVVAKTHRQFIAAKLKERDERHARAGVSRYLVEPNVKEGKGALRDLHTLFWMAAHLYGLHSSPSEYVRLGLFTKEEMHAFSSATEFLWKVRCHLHFLTGRAEERLTFDLQPEMAFRMGYGDRGSQPGVERFMKRYFLVAKEVGSLTRILCAKFEAEHHKGAPPLTKRQGARGNSIEPGFRILAGRVTTEELDAFERDPINMLRIFRVADRGNLDIHPDALSAIGRSLKRITPAIRRDPEACKVFLDIAASPNSPGETLKLMNEAGVLGRFMPEFGRVVAQMQFNMYHHYTVDEHTLRAVDVIGQIEKGVFHDEHPLSTEIFPKIINRRALFLAMLLHDTGKGIGDQEVEGEKSAIGACQRLGLPAEEVELVGWLVGHHLLMSDVAQKRDIGDPRTVIKFSQAVGNLERLRLLLVLTVADIRAVGPGVWNSWKGQLLRELYRLTEATFHGGRTDESGIRERLADQARQEREEVLTSVPADRAAQYKPWLEQADDAYWLSFDREAVLWHAEEIAKARGGTAGAYVAARPRPETGVTEILVYTDDRPGLFAALAQALAVSGADVTDARVYTTRDGKAFDVFAVQDASGDPYGVTSPDTLKFLLSRLRAAAAGEDAREQMPKRASPRRAAAFQIEPWVRFDDELSHVSTVIEVSARDRPGLLADLARVLAEGKVSIISAHIDAYGERVADVFYVQELDGEKLGQGARADALREMIIETLREGEPEAPSNAARHRLAVAPASSAR